MKLKFINVLRFMAERGKEPSTYRGAVAIAGLFGIAMGDQTVQAISAAGIALAGLIAVLTPDVKPPVVVAAAPVAPPPAG